MDTAEVVEQAPSGGYRDVRWLLILVGVLELLMGLCCALMIPLMLFAMVMATASQSPGVPPMHTGSMVAAAAFYGAVAIVAVWLGIGTLMCRRWARALSLVIASLWLACGVMGLLFWVFIAGDLFTNLPDGQQVPAGMVSFLRVFTTVLVSVFYVVLPGGGVIVFGNRHVRETCRRRDPRERWTDRCPLPVVALSVLFGFGTFSLVWIVFYNCAVPFFGAIVSGWAGAAMIAVLAVFLIWLTVALYRLRPCAWWAALIAIVLGMASWLVTFSRVGLVAYYEAMGLPAEQIDMIAQSGLLETFGSPLLMGLCWLPLILYLLWTKRFFQSPAS